MRTENPAAFSPRDISSLDLSSEKREMDLLAQHILAGRIHKTDLFSEDLEPKTPLEIEREVK